MQLSREMAMRGNARAAVGPGGDGVPPASLPPSLEQRMLDSLAGPEYGGGAEQRSPPSGGSMPRSGAGPPSGAPSSRGRPTTAKLRQLKASLAQKKAQAPQPVQSAACAVGGHRPTRPPGAA